MTGHEIATVICIGAGALVYMWFGWKGILSLLIPLCVVAYLNQHEPNWVNVLTEKAPKISRD